MRYYIYQPIDLEKKIFCAREIWWRESGVSSFCPCVAGCIIVTHQSWYPSFCHSVCQSVQLSDISLGTLPSVTPCARVYNCQTSVLGRFLLSLRVPECTIVRHQSWDPSFCHSVCQGVQLSDISLGTLPSVTLCARVCNCQTWVLGHFLLSLCVPECTIVRHESWNPSFSHSVCQSVQLSDISLGTLPSVTCVTGCTIVRHQSWDASFCHSVWQGVQLSGISLGTLPSVPLCARVYNCHRPVFGPAHKIAYFLKRMLRNQRNKLNPRLFWCHVTNIHLFTTSKS